MTEQKTQYDTAPEDLNELKKRYESDGGDWQDALEKIKRACAAGGIEAAIKEGWTVADFAKILLGGDGETQAAELPKQNLGQSADYYFTEAPASFNVKAISPQGFDVMLTLRDADTMELMKRGHKSLDWLISKGYKPMGRRGGGNGGNGSDGDDHPDTKICPIHHAPMKKREKDGQVWYSHKAVNPDTNQEYWCKGVTK